MSSQQPEPAISPPPVPVSPPTGVRRHHTISASSRRPGARAAISEEDHDQEHWNDDEVVDEDWVGGVGVVGEKSSLHRQSSLPTRYHRAFQPSTRQPGNLTPRTINSLSAIAGHEGDEDDWEREMRGLQNEEEAAAAAEHAQHQPAVDSHSQSSNASPMSPHFGPTHAPSPPPAASGVRRHQSLTHGPASGSRQIASSALKRSGTLQAQIRHPTVAEDHHSPSPPEAEEGYYDDSQAYDEETYYGQSPPASQQQFQATSPRGRQSPWNTPGEWRSPGSNSGSSNVAIDDVQRALSALEIASNTGQMFQTNHSNFQSGQSIHPPRFNPNHPPPAQAPGMRNNDNGFNNAGQSNRKLQPLVTDFDGRKTPTSQSNQGPASASPYVPPIGNHSQQQQQQQQQPQRGMSMNASSDRGFNASGPTPWDMKERPLGGRGSNPNLQYMYAQGQQGRPDGAGIPNVPPIPSQYLQQQHPGGPGLRPGVATQGQPGQGNNGGQSLQGFVNSPIDVPSLIALKGYNPSNFDIRPPFARFFVIKSYTEDDVHKSLKYEIWSSTDPGNKRLDKAFKECAGRGPIYLFFSVNASGHFCGMAEMLTPVDYTRSSTVWASDKWKGVFKVRWIFVRDIPNANLRHIRLNNTQERKPVTNSRDTQELLPDAGQEMLRIFSSHPARTSLLQDFAFYELQAMQKVQVQPGSASSDGSAPPIQSPQPQQQLASPNPSQQSHFAMASPNALYGGQMPQMTPMMQMQMQMNMPMNPQFTSHPQAQAMHQSVMRHPSPGPGGSGGGQPSFVNMGTQGF